MTWSGEVYPLRYDCSHWEVKGDPGAITVRQIDDFVHGVVTVVSYTIFGIVEGDGKYWWLRSRPSVLKMSGVSVYIQCHVSRFFGNSSRACRLGSSSKVEHA